MVFNKNIGIILLLFIVLSLLCKSQTATYNQKILNVKDSLEKYLQTAYQLINTENRFDKALYFAEKALKTSEKLKDYKSACRALNILGQCYYYLDESDNELKSYKKGLHYAQLINDKQQLFLFNSLLGNYYFTQEAYQKAIKYYLECLKLVDAENNKDQLSWLYNELGVAYLHLSNYEKALDYFFKSLPLKEEIHDNYGRANTLLNIGTVYYELNNYKKALEYLEQSLEIAEKENFINIQASILNNIGNIYSTIAEYDNAIKYLKKALKLKKELKDEKVIAGTYNNIGMAYEEKGNYKIAKVYYQKALKKYLKLKDPDGMSTAYRNLGNIEIKLNNIAQATQYLQTALAIADSNNLSLVKQNIYYSYSVLYSNLGNHKKSDKYYNMHIRLRDSLNNAEFSNRIAKLQILYDVEKKDREYKLLKLENEAKEYSIRKQQTMITFLSIILLLLIITAVAFYKMYQTRQQYNKELKEKNRLLEESEDNLKMINATKDKFFSIISHDLRNPFASMSLVVDNLKYNIDIIDKAKILKIISSLEETVNGTQDLLMNLLEWSRSQTGTIENRPKDFDISKLIANTLPLLESTASTKNIKIHKSLEPNAIVNADENMLKTVIRNLISNAIKFTPRGGDISIFVSLKNGMVETSVVDSGIGIPPEAIDKLFKIDAKIKTKGTENEEGTGLGLILCKEFVEKHHGSIEVSSEVNRGSKFTFCLPYANHTHENL